MLYSSKYYPGIIAVIVSVSVENRGREREEQAVKLHSKLNMFYNNYIQVIKQIKCEYTGSMCQVNIL